MKLMHPIGNKKFDNADAERDMIHMCRPMLCRPHNKQMREQKCIDPESQRGSKFDIFFFVDKGEWVQIPPEKRYLNGVSLVG